MLTALSAARQTLGVPDMPVLFTELGYTSWSGTTIQPWLGGGFTTMRNAETGLDELVVPGYSNSRSTPHPYSDGKVANRNVGVWLRGLQLATSVREVFPGLLTYGANFDEFAGASSPLKCE